MDVLSFKNHGKILKRNITSILKVSSAQVHMSRVMEGVDMTLFDHYFVSYSTDQSEESNSLHWPIRASYNVTHFKSPLYQAQSYDIITQRV